jgi:HYDIN/CFA65/VesB family protein
MATASASITITNTGNGALSVSVTPPKHSPPLTEIGGGNGIEVAPGKAYTVTIVFSPTKKGSTNDQILILGDDPKQKKPVKVRIKAKSK